jgi:hypothetical protein
VRKDPSFHGVAFYLYGPSIRKAQVDFSGCEKRFGKKPKTSFFATFSLKTPQMDVFQVIMTFFSFPADQGDQDTSAGRKPAFVST